jgi:diaminopimelate epimerase
VNIDFIKLHSSGSDVIVIDADSLRSGSVDPVSLARAILKRRRGAGADALAIVDAAPQSPTKGGQAKGSRSQVRAASVKTYLPSGEAAHADADALICAARYLFDSGKAGGERFELSTPSGKRRIDVATAVDFTVSLGMPRSSGSDADAVDENIPFTVLEAGGKRVSVCAIELCRTYLALLTQDGNSGRLEELERASGADPRGPSSARAIIVRPIARDTLRIRHSAAMGWDGASAAGAALVAAVAAGSVDREAAVLSVGGVRYAEWNARDNKVSVTAPAEYVYEGEWYMPDEAPLEAGTEAEEAAPAQE